MRAFLRFMFSNARHDPDAEQHYAEHVLRAQMEEWTQGNEQPLEQESFHCGGAHGFDLHL